MNIPGYMDAVSGSLYNIGNTLRLRRALEKKNINLAFAGGSADKCLSFLREKYPSIKYTVSLADRNSKKLAPENGSKLSAFIEELKSELISN